VSIKISKKYWGFHGFFKIGVPKNYDVPMMFPLENLEKMQRLDDRGVPHLRKGVCVELHLYLFLIPTCIPMFPPPKFNPYPSVI
jgi:hypothetical protein